MLHFREFARFYACKMYDRILKLISGGQGGRCYLILHFASIGSQLTDRLVSYNLDITQVPTR